MFLLIFATKNWSMEIGTLISIGCIIALLILGYFMFFGKTKSQEKEIYVPNEKGDDNINEKGDDNIRVVSYKLTVPLRIQACERLILYIERIQFPVLIKRVFYPGISRNDFQFALLQNVQDEFEHNLAQRLYVSETTWQLIVLAKEEVLQNLNAVFGDNPDADVALIAQQLASFENPMAEKAVVNIKKEFNSL